MELTISKKDIAPVMKLVGENAPSKPKLAIYANLQISINNNLLSITSGSGNTETALTLPIKVPHKEGSVSVNARKLNDIISNLADDSDIRFFKGNTGKLTVTSGRSRFTLSTISTDDYPVMETQTPENPTQISIKGIDFSIGLSRVIPSMAVNDSRHFLNGVLIECKNNQVSLIATDGHRLSKNTLKNATYQGKPTSLIIPRDSVLQLQKLSKVCNTNNITLIFGNRHLIMDAKIFIYKTNLIEGKYPDVNRVAPNKAEGVCVEFPRKALKQTIQRAGLLANEKYHGIEMTLGAGKASFESMKKEVEDESSDVLSLDYQGESISTAFNKTLMDSLISTGDDDTIELRLYGEGKAIRIDMPESGHFSVLMPMKA